MCEPAGQLLGMLSRLLMVAEYMSLAEEIYQDTFSAVSICVYVCVCACMHVLNQCD